MEEELITVVVPVYNAEEYLPYCLRSISAQTYRNLEIILVDDGSTDSSGRICDGFALTDSRARVIHQENRKLWAARNRGLEEARGEYVFFPDADDYFHKDFLRILHKAINHNGKRYPMSMCGVRKTSVFSEDVSSDITWDEAAVSESGRDEIFYGIFKEHKWWYHPSWNKLYRRSSLEIPFQREYLRSQDLDSNIRFYEKNDSVVFVDLPLYYWVQHPGQLTRMERDWDIRYECEIRMFSGYLLDSSDISGNPYAHYYFDRLYKRMAVYKARNMSGPRREGIKAYCRSIEKKTIGPLFRCRNLPFYRKLFLVAYLHGGIFTRLFLKLTHNL